MCLQNVNLSKTHIIQPCQGLWPAIIKNLPWNHQLRPRVCQSRKIDIKTVPFLNILVILIIKSALEVNGHCNYNTVTPITYTVWLLYMASLNLLLQCHILQSCTLGFTMTQYGINVFFFHTFYDENLLFRSSPVWLTTWYRCCSVWPVYLRNWRLYQSYLIAIRCLFVYEWFRPQFPLPTFTIKCCIINLKNRQYLDQSTVVCPQKQQIKVLNIVDFQIWNICKFISPSRVFQKRDQYIAE